MSQNTYIFNHDDKLNIIGSDVVVIKENTKYVDYYEYKRDLYTCDIHSTSITADNNVFLDIDVNNIGLHLAVGYNANSSNNKPILYTSLDGIKFEESEWKCDESTIGKFINIAYGDNKFVILSEDIAGSQYSLYITTDGKELTKLVTKECQKITKLIYDDFNNLFIACGYTETESFIFYADSNDLNNWIYYTNDNLKQNIHINDIVRTNYGYSAIGGKLDGGSYKIRFFTAPSVNSWSYKDVGGKKEGYLLIYNVDVSLAFDGESGSNKTLYRSTTAGYWKNIPFNTGSIKADLSNEGVFHKGIAIGDDYFLLSSGSTKLYVTASAKDILTIDVGDALYNVKRCKQKIFLTCGNNKIKYMKLYVIGRRPEQEDRILRNLNPIGSRITGLGFNNPYYRLGFGHWYITNNGAEDHYGLNEQNDINNPYGLEYTYLRIL